MSTSKPWQEIARRRTSGIATLADAITAMNALAAAYGRVDVERLTSAEYLLLYPIDGVIERRMETSPNFVCALTGSHWASSVWNDLAFQAANEVLRAAEGKLESRLVAFATGATRGFLDDACWLAMVTADAKQRGMSHDDITRALAKARRDATSGLASGWVWVKAGDLLEFYRQLDRWRSLSGKTSPIVKETIHDA